MTRSVHPLARLVGKLLIALLSLLLLSACRIESSLLWSLPDRQSGGIWATSPVTQPFLAPHDGLSWIKVGVSPRQGDRGQNLPNPTDGARLEIHYAPESDDRFPERQFHDWPADHEWLGELTANRIVGQEFTSPYPNLSGITVRIATFGGDFSPGIGRLRDGEPVIVRALPISGDVVSTVAGGSELPVNGAAEGWASVTPDDGITGFIDQQEFVSLPQPARRIATDLNFSLVRADDQSEIRRLTIPAENLRDNSHLTFQFDPIEDSLDQRYIFSISAPDGQLGSSVTLRFSPSDSYSEGTRLEQGEAVEGDLIFRPVFSAGAPLYSGALDEFLWSGRTTQDGSTYAAERSFSPIPSTKGRYLKLAIVPGNSPVAVSWSLLRPPGGKPLSVDGDPSAPQGGIVFNANFSGDAPIGTIVKQSLGGVRRAAGGDPIFFAFYGVAIMALFGWGISGPLLRRRRRDTETRPISR